MGNSGAFITFKGNDLTPQFTKFSASSHPEVKPMQYAGDPPTLLLAMFCRPFACELKGLAVLSDPGISMAAQTVTRFVTPP